MKKTSLIILALFSLQLWAKDEGTRFLPSHGRDVTATHKDKEKIKKLTENFVKAMEGKDKAAYLKLSTPNLNSNTDWKDNWNSLPSTMSPALLEIRDFFIMEHKKKDYVRFSVADLKLGKIHYLPNKTWYRVKKVKDEWKMDAFLPGFEPDGGP